MRPPCRSVECLVADSSVTAGATTSRVLMIAVNSPEISGFTHFVKDVKKSFAVFDGISDGPGAIGVLNNPVRRCRSEGVFDEHAVGGHLSSLALMRTGAGAVARFQLNRNQAIRSFHQIVWLPGQAATRRHQGTLDIAASVGVLVDNATIWNPTLPYVSTGARPHEQSH